jgi:hypothetical protein
MNKKNATLAPDRASQQHVGKVITDATKWMKATKKLPL